MEDSSKKKVRVIDDERDIVRVLTIMLEVQGYATASAASRGRGTEKACCERPDAIVMGVMMPAGRPKAPTRHGTCAGERPAQRFSTHGLCRREVGVGDGET
jgi:CheY-like chemotaxis protein